MSTKVTVKGQVTLPKAIRDAAGIKPGDRVDVRLFADGGVIVESVDEKRANADYLSRLHDLRKRRPITEFTTDEIMEMTRGDG